MSRRFVYGHFDDSSTDFTPNNLATLAGLSAPQTAIEIVREYSANQFVGKLYRKSTSGNWVPVDAGRLETYPWYKQFQETKQLQFEMDGSGPWDVLHFRVESDETGPYVAVALQYAQQQLAVGQ
jgi:hypothetical protein